MTDFSKTLIRCSAIGSIMSNGKGSYSEGDESKLNTLKLKLKRTENQDKQYKELLDKKELGVLLSESCKKYLIKTYSLEKYHRVREEPVTKQMIKGIVCEEDSIDLFSRVEKRFYNKNTIRISNEYIIGTPDLYDGETVNNSNEIIDIKSSWDIETFLKNIDGELNPAYYWQIQGYMAISGAKTGTIAYCLVNAPFQMIEEEKRKMFFKMNVATEENVDYKIACAQIEHSMTFDDIPIEEKILRFTVDRNDEDIEKIYEKVKRCRLFLSEFELKHQFFTKKHRKSILVNIQNGIRNTADTEC